MKIGIVSLYPFIKNIKNVVNAVESLGHTTKVLNLYSIKSSIIYELIKKSNITHWIFSGSPLCVVEKKSPKIPIEILDLEDKKFMLICYSMESMIFQLNYPITIRRELKKEVINLDVDMEKVRKLSKDKLFENISLPISVWRNHYGYLSSYHINNLTEVSNYQNESMIIFHKNSVLLQIHPERTKDGYKLIDNWINYL
jgi:GMP synthase-like glutamine amidotransferase